MMIPVGHSPVEKIGQFIQEERCEVGRFQRVKDPSLMRLSVRWQIFEIKITDVKDDRITLV